MKIIKIKHPRTGKWMVVIDGAMVVTEDEYDPRRTGISLDEIPEHKRR